MTIPTSDIDFYSDAVIFDPFPVYDILREKGPVAYLPQNDLYALSRYAEVSAVLRQPHLFDARAQRYARPPRSGTNGVRKGRQHKDHSLLFVLQDGSALA